MAIVQICGTSGSGKSTLVRRVMDLYQSKSILKIEGRRQPLCYTLGRHDGGPELTLVGHYETVCGGCDTIANMDDIYAIVRQAALKGMDVLFEGLLISADANRIIALFHDIGDRCALRVIALDTPIEVCLSSINARRLASAEAKGKPYKGDVKPKNTVSKFAGVKRMMQKTTAAGVRATWESRDSAFHVIQQELKLC